jgi:hypothetical protein
MLDNGDELTARPVTLIAFWRRKTGRPTGADANEIRDDHQPENGEGARFERAALAACDRRRGDRIKERDFRSGS